jgi:hypothetical protein
MKQPAKKQPKRHLPDFTDLLRKLPPMSKREEEFLKQRWRRQIKPKSEALLDQAKNFYIVVGQGISHWSRMEESLVLVVAKLLRSSEVKTGMLMYSIINFNVWLQIIDDLFVLDGTYPNSQKKWRQIQKALRAEKDTRDALAHHAMVQIEEVHGDTTGVQAYLRPSRRDARNKSKKTKPLTLVQILDFTGRVNDVHEQIILLLKQMKQPKASR